MKIAINCAFFLPKGGGIKEYIGNLVTNLLSLDNENEYIFYVLADAKDYAMQNLPSSIKLKVMPFTSVNKVYRSLFEYRYWKAEEIVEKFDIFHSPFFHSPKFRYAKVILTVHDLRFCRFPSTYTKLRLWYLKYAVKKSVLSCNHIISISQFTKDELMKIYGINGEKISVVHEAVNIANFNIDLGDYKPVWCDKLFNKRILLTVGHLEPRKNYNRLIQSFSKLKENKCNKDVVLVIVGKKGHHYQNTLQLIATTKDVLYLDFVEHKDLVWLYQKAALFVFPSYYEGFGFPPLEAAANGLISAVSNVSSMPEICGNSVAYFNPYDINDMSTVVDLALNDLNYRVVLKSRSLLNLNRFSWQKNANETLAIYKKMVTSK